MPERLRFWDGFFNGPVAAQLLSGDAAAADEQMHAAIAQAGVAAANRMGEVYLIGVGPGDPDLLTIRAQQLLQQADVLLYDRLASRAQLPRSAIVDVTHHPIGNPLKRPFGTAFEYSDCVVDDSRLVVLTAVAIVRNQISLKSEAEVSRGITKVVEADAATTDYSYTAAGLPEVATALSVLTGESHPLAIS